MTTGLTDRLAGSKHWRWINACFNYTLWSASEAVMNELHVCSELGVTIKCVHIFPFTSASNSVFLRHAVWDTERAIKSPQTKKNLLHFQGFWSKNKYWRSFTPKTWNKFKTSSASTLRISVLRKNTTLWVTTSVRQRISAQQQSYQDCKRHSIGWIHRQTSKSVLLLKIKACRYVAPYRLVNGYTPFERLQPSLRGLLDPEFKVTMIFRNVGNYLPTLQGITSRKTFRTPL
jgi:hypothetical protein